MRFIHFIRLSASLIFISILYAGCATTHQTREVTTSGFLSDYAQLQKGTGHEALMVYINESVDFSRYDKIIIDPTRLVASEDSDLAKIPQEELQSIADYFHAALVENLSKRYTVVSEPGPDTMRLRVALTDVTGSKVVLDTLSSIIPIGMAVNAIEKVATGNNTAVGSATGELELLDSVSGQRLAAAVDGRSGTKYTGRFDKFKKWTDAKDACDYWAKRLAKRLEELSTGENGK